jgi:hypothetical protein
LRRRPARSEAERPKIRPSDRGCSPLTSCASDLGCSPRLRVSAVKIGVSFPIPAISERRAAQTGVPDEPDVGLAGWNFAAPQTVILKERPFLPRMKDLNREAIPLPRLARPLPLPGDPTASQPIPVWREFERCTPNSSHFGVHFSDEPFIWRRVQRALPLFFYPEVSG